MGSVFRLFLRRPQRPALMGLGIFIVTAGIVLTAIASQTVVGTVEKDISHFWRTTYDILVRPAGARTPVEEKYGLVEANFTSRIQGGITMDQYQTIREIPDVEIAAPIAALTYVPLLPDDTILTPPDPGFYLLEREFVLDQGARVWENRDEEYVYNGPVPPNVPASSNTEIQYGTTYAVSHPPVALLMAAIDPPMEAALVGLDRAMREGKYLTGNEQLSSSREEWPGPWGVQTVTVIKDVPVLVNATPYVHFTSTIRISRLLLPEDVADLKTVLERGGLEYLKAVAQREVLEEDSMESTTAYRQMIRYLLHPEEARRAEQYYSIMAQLAESSYRDVSPPFPYNGLVLERVFPESREEGTPEITMAITTAFHLRAVGVFDIEKIPRPTDESHVPLETYFPPVAVLRYDEEGHPVTPAPLRPGFSLERYMPSPPFLLTTLEAARRLAGDNCISAIRVRVRGIDQLTPEAQQRVAAVAAEIHRRTGLDVDIMIGSSPTRVLARIPGIGYVEEEWIRKGVAFAYRQRVHSGHLLLISSLLIIGGAFVLDLAWADFLARRRAVALQKALGWRTGTVLRYELARTGLVVLLAAALGAIAGWGLSSALGWSVPGPAILIVAPTVVGITGLLGGLYPAWAAARIPLTSLLRGNEVPTGGRPLTRPADLFRYVWHGLERRRTRTLLSVLAATLSTALLVLLLVVTADRHQYLSGTLLGEYILVRVERHHYILVLVGFILATMALAEHLLAGVLERWREIGVLKAVGWRTRTVWGLFLLEGALLGLGGGLAGTALGLGAHLALHREFGWGLLKAALAGMAVPMLVGIAAALYPAHVAARVPPAEAVRAE